MIPLITTIIPTYKRPQLLKKAIKSVLNQTYPHFQVCIYDNASGDETEEIVAFFAKHDPRVKYHCHSSNIGMMGNYEFAFKELTTTYFSFLSDDDALLPCFYETALESFQTFPEIGFSACSITIINKEGKPLRTPLMKWPKQVYYPAAMGMPEMIGKYPIPTGVLFHKKIKEKVEIDIENAIVWDCDFLMHIAGHYPIAISKKQCGFFLAHETSFSASTDFERFQAGFLHILERIKASTQFSPDIVKFTEKKLRNDLAKSVFFDGLKKLLERNYLYVFQASKKLKRDYKTLFLGRVLLLSAYVYRFFPLAHLILFFLHYIKQIAKKKNAHLEAGEYQKNIRYFHNQI